MSQEKFKVQNYFSTTITSTIPADSSDGSFTVQNAPSSTNFYIMVSYEDATKRELIKIYNRVGNTLYYRGVDRPTPKVHLANDSATMNVMAEYINYFDDVLGKVFNHEKVSNLQFKVFGGQTYIGKTLVNIADQVLTMTNESANYVYFDTSDNIIKTSVDAGDYATNVLLYTVSCAGGIITSIVRVGLSKMSYKPDDEVFSVDYETLVPTEGQTVFTMSKSAGPAQGMKLYLNGSLQIENDTYTVSGDKLTWTGVGLDALDKLVINWGVPYTGTTGGTSYDWVKDEFTATLAQTEFILSNIPADNESVEVVINDAGPYTVGTDYTIAGDTITWLNNGFTLTVGDVVEVKYVIIN